MDNAQLGAALGGSLLPLVQKVAAERDWPRKCVHRGEVLKMRPANEQRTRFWKVWHCPVMQQEVTWKECKVFSEQELCDPDGD